MKVAHSYFSSVKHPPKGEDDCSRLSLNYGTKKVSLFTRTTVVLTVSSSIHENLRPLESLVPNHTVIIRLWIRARTHLVSRGWFSLDRNCMQLFAREGPDRHYGFALCVRN